MNTNHKNRSAQTGHALLMVMITTTIALATLAATMQWNSNNVNLNERNNRYFAAVAAAEAATEKVLSEVSGDYYGGGPALVKNRLSGYAGHVPLASEHAQWNNYVFETLGGVVDQIEVPNTLTWKTSPLISQYRGLSGYASTLRLRAAARDVQSQYNVVGAVEQEIQLATIPLFQFAIFYNLDLEINPGPKMDVGGRVHSNYDMYTIPGNTLTFEDSVTSAMEIHSAAAHPADPNQSRTLGKLVFEGEHDSGVSTLNLPLGVENTPENTRAILQVPPSTEHPISVMGEQRFYNKSDLVIVVQDPPENSLVPTISVLGHNSSGSTLSLSYADISSFVTVKTNAVFRNAREQRNIIPVEINVGNLRTWSEAGNTLTTELGRNVNSIYVADYRTQTASTQPGVRLSNGRYLPADGLTVSTPNPLYVQGHYNAPITGTTDTSLTKPAALLADAVNVLSPSWNDAKSWDGLSSRGASSTTVNAAIMAGIVETVPGSYSGGVENYPRFLEDWGGDTLTYNGSMVVLFPSAQATGKWRGTGSSIGIYNPPNRDWHFDKNFLDPNKLPPLTPMVISAIRGEWKIVSK